MPATRQSMSSEAIEELITQRVADALATYETNRNTRNGNGNGSGSQSHGGSGSRRIVNTARGCTYMEFLNCQPLNFKGTKVVYTYRFQKLALLCSRMVLEEEDKVESYIWGLPDSIQGNVTSAGPVRLQDTVKLANSLMDQKVRVYAARQADNKRRMENNLSDNHV
ncbi:hypothetical protein Tco_0374247 [Tanacetum coccineum]